MPHGYRVALLAGLLVISTAQYGRADPILVNGGFETGDLSGWTISFPGAFPGFPGAPPNAYGVGADGDRIPGASFFGPTYVTARSGRFAAFEDGAAGRNPSQSLLLSQTLTLDPGLYFIGFHVGSDTPTVQTGFGSSVKILINGAPLSLNVWSDTIPSDGSFQEFSGRFSAAGGPTTVGFLISGSGTGAAGISADDAFVTASPAPEPASMMLFATGLAGLYVRRRRSRCHRTPIPGC
jgi:hypothetical protein